MDIEVKPDRFFNTKMFTRVFVLVVMLTVLVCSWLPPLDDPATQRVDDGLKRALITYATARLLYGAVSVAQGTQIAATPAGIGATFTPGQILAPVAELLKTFSDLMLLVCVSFGIQKLLIAVGSFWFISLALSAVAVAWTALYVKEKPLPAWLTKTLIVLLLVRFAVPLTVLGADQIFESILKKEYQTSQAALESVTKEAESTVRTETTDAAELAGSETPGLLDRVKIWVKNKWDATVARFKGIKSKIEDSVMHMVTLMAVFVLQTIVLPLLLLLGLYHFARVTLQMPLRRNPFLKE